MGLEKWTGMGTGHRLNDAEVQRPGGLQPPRLQGEAAPPAADAGRAADGQEAAREGRPTILRTRAGASVCSSIEALQYDARGVAMADTGRAGPTSASRQAALAPGARAGQAA
ncbi:unnamed protein product [Prorocentrum cordatum]|uniref:Uncharacterized protein n=1 Tax=Prorocentrum cordatum TaxID=2364126 RepID=A0ABN9PBB2_9DINO|nr:unnamed protein product [Polarella glacialis]